jgi:hypothetical protein
VGGFAAGFASARGGASRYLLEMVLAKIAGMAMLGVAIWALGEPPGYADLLVEHGLMGVSMAAPMVAWMRHRGHTWSDGLEMMAAMLVPIFAVVLPVELGCGGTDWPCAHDALPRRDDRRDGRTYDLPLPRPSVAEDRSDSGKTRNWTRTQRLNGGI